MIPLSWRIGAVLALCGVLTLCGTAAYHHIDKGGYERAVAERAVKDAAAVIARTKENAAEAAKQSSTNTAITKAKDEELAPVVKRIYVDRVRVGPALCGGVAAPAETASPSRSDGDDSTGRLVRDDLERDLRALELRVEEALATGRACQAWVRENGFAQ